LKLIIVINYNDLIKYFTAKSLTENRPF
jgi:hypothetical protein